MSLPLRSMVAMASVKSVPASIVFYSKLGFEVHNTFTPDDQKEPTWAWLASENAQFMVTKATEPVSSNEQAVLFYIYCDDVNGKRVELERAGIQVGEMKYPFYSPKGEFQVTDPDGYVLMMTHT